MTMNTNFVDVLNVKSNILFIFYSYI
jgi:hypothetical protein